MEGLGVSRPHGRPHHGGGLDWGHVWLGRNASDPQRHLHVQESRARGKYPGPTKTGAGGRVQLSKRLWRLLFEEWMRRGQPERGPVVVKGDLRNYGRRFFARACKNAEIGRRTPKDLRDTYASWLLTLGVPLGYVSAQLLHKNPATTGRHYARWIEEAEYRRPEPLADDEVPADLLARLEGTVSRPSHTVSESDGDTMEGHDEFTEVFDDAEGIPGGPPGDRTLDQRVKSPVLYQLSWRPGGRITDAGAGRFPGLPEAERAGSPLIESMPPRILLARSRPSGCDDGGPGAQHGWRAGRLRLPSGLLADPEPDRRGERLRRRLLGTHERELGTHQACVARPFRTSWSYVTMPSISSPAITGAVEIPKRWNRRAQ